MFPFRRKRDVADTQPMTALTPDKMAAIAMLNEARNRRQEAEDLNAVIANKATALAGKRADNHFYESFVTILRTE